MQDLFYAINESNNRIALETQKLGKIYRLTLNRESVVNAKKLYFLPGLSEAHAGDAGYWVLPRSISMNGEFQTFFTPREDLTYSYSAPVMSCYGIKKDGLCCLVRIERSFPYRIEMQVKNGDYRLSISADLTDGSQLPEEFCFEVIPLENDADYNDMARAERELRLSRGEIVPLAEKCRKNAVEYARKYPLIRIRMGWKPSPSPIRRQTEETEPPMFVACDFDRVCKIADMLHEKGLRGAEFQLVGWNRSGHDGRFPQLFPADPRLGGNEGLARTIEHVKKLGYRISTHTNSIDAVPIADTFTWDDIAVKANGKYNQTGYYSGGVAYHVCLVKQWKNTKRDLPRLADMGENGLHFTDVISIVVPDECYSPAHPSSVENGIIYAQKIMSYTSGLFGGFSSEGCMDFSLRDLDFGLYVSFASGFGEKVIPFADRYIPFFELTYHGIVLYNPTSPTINYTIKDAATRLELYMHGGRPTMYYYSRFRTGGALNWMGEVDLACKTDDEMNDSTDSILRAADEYRAHADRRTVYMTGYDCTDDGVQIATHENGERMIGNFTDTEKTFEGHTVPPMDFIVLGDRL